jgi:CBS domain-containing protein
MKAKDVMTSPVITVGANATVHDVACLLVERGISAVPVCDGDKGVIGIVSEGDLLRRKEIGSKKRRSWWLELLTGSDILARDYTQSHSFAVRDVMRSPVISVSEETPLAEIADILEEHRIKRVTVMREGKLVGLVSRADLVRALARAAMKADALRDDKSIRNTMLQRIKSQPWASSASVNFLVEGGVIELHGLVSSGDQHRALRVLAETVPGVKSVRDRIVEMPNLPTHL